MVTDEPGGTSNDDAMRVAESNICAHRHEFVGKEHSGFVHPVVHKDRTGSLGGEDNKRAHKIGRETGPKLGLEFLANAQFLGVGE